MSSKINLAGSSLRETRAIAAGKAHPNSASELKIEVRLVEGVQLGGDGVGAPSHSWQGRTPSTLGQKTLPSCIRIGNQY
jgi:hypothetical protein